MSDRNEAIRARCEQATPGKWFVNEEKFEPYGVELQIYDTNGWEKDLDPIAALDLFCGQPDNAAFIAHAREDIPYLLDEVERLTAALAAMNKEVGEWRDLAISTADKWANKIIESFDYSKRVRRARRQRDEWRERAEAAERDLDRYGQCGACKNYYRKNGCGANDYSWCDGGFKWRGPCAENGGTE